MTNQEIFDKVVTHLRQQGRPAAYADGCRYRAENELSCAVGCLISDADYTSDIEGLAVTEIDPRILWNSGIGPDQMDLLTDLQLCHDESPTFSKLLCRLTVAANRNNISHGLVDDWHLEVAPEELARVWRAV